jgi:hypothetical protein
VISESGAFFALDLGSATTSAALVGHLGGRWRLIANASAPSGVEPTDLLTDILCRVAAADPAMLELLAADRPVEPRALAESLPRLVARSTPPRHLVVLAGSRRQRRLLELAAYRSGWLVSGGSADDTEMVTLARMAVSSSCDAILLGADRTPAGDERRFVSELAGLAAAARRLRPSLTVVLAGGAAAHEPAFEAAAPVESAVVSAVARAESRPESALWNDDDDSAADPTAAEPDEIPLDDVPGDTPGELPANVLLAPDVDAGHPQGSALQQVLEGLRVHPDDARRGMVRSVASLAEVLGRTVEVAEVGFGGGLRARSQPGAAGSAAGMLPVMPADGSISPETMSDETIDSVLSWSTVAFDRHRLDDLLHDLRLSPWVDADGDGAVLRAAAARAALWRLGQAAPELASQPLPEVLVAAGGAFAAMPPAVAALVLADMIRRPGAAQLVFDHARLLGPLGVLPDEGERRRLLANLAEDILLPLGFLLLPVGLKAGRSGGQLRVEGRDGPSDIELHPGTLQIVDLQPGQAARVVADFRETVRLAAKGRHFVLDVVGGIAGLLVDLRDVPLRLPERPEPRRAALAALQDEMWPWIDE